MANSFLRVISAFLLAASLARAKSGRTYYDDATLSAARDRVATYDWAKAEVAGYRAEAAWCLQQSRDELWDLVPPPEQLRALNVSFGRGCPDCGRKIFRSGGHYPWRMSRERPFKVICPVCENAFPENTFEPWNTDSLADEPQSGERRIDHGSGWLDTDGNRYFFVGHYVFRQRWQRDILPAVDALSKAFLFTDDPAYGRRCAVMIANIAANYPDFDYRTQAYHNGRWPAGINGRILDYIWENGVIGRLALAYDAVYPVFDDPELKSFLAGKGIDAPRRLIETNLLRTMIEDLRRGFVRGNMGMHQRAMCYAAIVYDNQNPDDGPVTADLVKWIMTGGGNTEYLLWNGFYRDGHGGESSPSYSSGWGANFYTVARLLPRLGVEIWENPKVRKMADIGPDMYVAGTSCPSIGDCGTIFGAGRVGWSAALQGPAFMHYRDPRHAKILTEIDATAEQLFEPLFDPMPVEEAAKGVSLSYRTRNLGGYGLAILESGGPGSRRGACMYYGHAGGGHGHRDRLTIQLMAYGKPFLTDMGYPAHWLPKNTYWTSNSVSHYTVLVNAGWQRTLNRGFLNTIADAGFVQLMDASAPESAYPGVTSRYRRTVALIDIDRERSYLLDVFRVKGGDMHDYSYHGPPFAEFSVQGATPGPRQDKGTLMGPDVPFGSSKRPVGTLGKEGLVIPLRSSQDVLDDSRPYAERSQEGWATYASGETILTRKKDAAMAVDIPALPAKPVKVFLRVHDYNAGSNTVEVALGPYRTEITWEPSGTTGYRWVSSLLDLGEAVQQFRMRAVNIGQSYALIQSVVLSTDLQAETPRFVDARTSGYQYLFNVRRMTPDGMWSATWRDPDSNLALTMTVPAGVAPEAILADAEAELKPNHPDTLQYVLLRNAPDTPPDDGVASTFVTVSEPHRGAPDVHRVEQLRRRSEKDDSTVGLVVQTADHTDLVHSSLEPDAACRWQTDAGEWTVQAEFAAASIDETGVSRAVLINGTAMSLGDFSVTSDGAPSGRIVAVNHSKNQIVLDRELPRPDVYVGRVLISGNELQRTSYTVVEAENVDGRAVLGFGTTLFMVQMGVVEAVDSDNGQLRLSKLERVDGGQHEGRWLYNEDRTTGFRIEARSGNAYTVSAKGADLQDVFSDRDGDGLVRFWISDLGPDNWWRLPAITVYERQNP